MGQPTGRMNGENRDLLGEVNEMMKLKKISAFLLVLMMVFSFVGCGNSNGDANTGDNGDGNSGADNSTKAVYKVGMEATFPPFDTTNPETQEVDGFDYDLMEAIAADQGFELKWIITEFNGLVPSLESGNIDIIASAMNASPDRRAKVDFSTTYYDSGLVLAVKAGNTTLKGIDDLKETMKVGAQIGTTGADLCLELKEEGKVKEAKIYNGVDTAVMDLQNGSIDGLINDLPVTKKYMEVKPGTIEIVGDVLNAEAYGYAVKKGNQELLDKINTGMQNLKDNGKFDEIYAKWLE